jgi:hypothetical protein
MPASPVGADFDLGRERALGDLAVDGGPGQPSPGEHSFQTDDTVRFAHRPAASCWLLLTASETRQDRVLQAGKGNLHIAVLWRRVGGKSDGSNFDSPTSTSAKVDAVAQGEFEAEPVA